jgi:putative membrane protein
VLGAGGTFLLSLLGLQAYDFVLAQFARSPWLGGAFSLLLGLVVLGLLGIIGRELWSIARLAKVDHLRQRGERLMAAGTHGQAEPLLRDIEQLYRARAELDRPIVNFHEQASDALNDGERLQFFAQTVLAPLDRQAYRLVRNAARDISVLTALTPISALDSLIVLVRTLSAMRAIARLYGVRPGFAATMQLIRRAARNIVIAGVGDLMSHAALETAGASILRILSARAGQGAINGLLAARIGLSIMQICRPLPFTEPELPSLQRLRTEILNELGRSAKAEG